VTPEPDDPRCARSRAAILAAAADLVAEAGLQGFSMDDLAARAGVGKATIYRHWRGRDELLVDASWLLCEPAPVPDTGSLRDDLLAVVRHLCRVVSSPVVGPMISAFIEAAQHDPDMRRAHEEMTSRRREPLRAVLRRGQARGELPAGVPHELAADLVVGPVFYRRFVSHGKVDDRFADQLVARALAGLGAAEARSPA
jgi:AcrR family transcriptional regulator